MDAQSLCAFTPSTELEDAGFKNGDVVIIYDTYEKITGYKKVAVVDYWIKASKYRAKKIDTKYGHLYFLKYPNGNKLGPYRTEDLRKL